MKRMVWKPVEAYSQIFITGEDDQEYTIGVDGDDNAYVENCATNRVLLACPPSTYRLCRQVETDVPSMPVEVRESLEALLVAWRFYHGPTTSWAVVRAWLEAQENEHGE